MPPPQGWNAAIKAVEKVGVPLSSTKLKDILLSRRYRCCCGKLVLLACCLPAARSGPAAPLMLWDFLLSWPLQLYHIIPSPSAPITGLIDDQICVGPG